MSISHRIKRLREAMAARNLDAFIIQNNSDLRWLTGFEAVFDDEEAHVAFITKDAALLHTDSRYVTAFDDRAEKTEWKISSEAISHSDFLANAAVEASPSRIAIESSMQLSFWRGITRALEAKGCNAELVETSEIVLWLRAVKDEAEVAAHRAAQAVTDAAFCHMIEWMHVGQTEIQIQCELENWMRCNGSDGLGFTSIIATGSNSASPHCVPGNRQVEPGDFLIMDFGAKVRDYRADMTRTVVFGEPSAKQREIYDVVRAANEACEAAIQSGLLGKDIHSIAVKIIGDAGYGDYFGHGLGHGVGLDIHEMPSVGRGPAAEHALEVNSIVTVEPGIYLPGFGGVRIEDFGRVTDSGFEVFTKSTHDLIVL